MAVVVTQRTTQFKGNGISFPKLLNGLWQVAGGHGQINPKVAAMDMWNYVEAGLTGFDMADHYGNAELFYGDLLTKAKQKGIALTGFTKWVPSPGPMPLREVEENIDKSLQRMKVDQLDLLQFHWWEYKDNRYLDACKGLAQLQAKNKIRHIGLTNFDTVHMKSIVDAGVEIVSNQVSYSIIDRRPEKHMVEYCLANNILLLTYGTLLGGFFSEKYVGVDDSSLVLDTSSLKKYKRFITAWGGWGLFQELLVELKAVAAKHNVGIANVATRFILDKPAVGAVIVGARLGISNNIRETLKTYDLHLDAEDIAKIEKIANKGNTSIGLADCGDEYR